MIRARVRSTGDRGIGWFLFCSLSLHGLILVAILLHRKPVSIGYQTATTVSLVSEDTLSHSTQSSQSKPIVHNAPVKPVLAPKPVVTPHPIIHHKPAPLVTHKSIIPKIKAKPVTLRKVSHPLKNKLVMPQKKSIKVKSMGAHKQKTIHSTVSKNASTPLNPTVPVQMDVAGERFPTYLQHLLISRIKSNWAPPPGSEGLNATIHFVLNKDGSIVSDPVLVTSSGSRVFDDAVRFAILRSVPFPPFPPSYGRDKEDVTVTLQAIKRQGF